MPDSTAERRKLVEWLPWSVVQLEDAQYAGDEPGPNGVQASVRLFAICFSALPQSPGSTNIEQIAVSRLWYLERADLSLATRDNPRGPRAP